MNKKDSLAFLDECLNKLNNATKEDIANYKIAYEQNCSSYLVSDSFEFCTPLYTLENDGSFLLPPILKKDVIEIDYATKNKQGSIDYLLNKNEQVSDKEECLSFAA